MARSDAVLHLAGGVISLATALWTSTAQAAGDVKLRSDLSELMRRTVFFGHQSVGVNILDGVMDLARQEGLPIRITEAQSAAAISPGTWAHGFIAENGNPLLKIQSFERMFATPTAKGPNVAMMKFCYVDFNEGTDVRALFARYQAALRELRAQNPGTTFVHFTVPLTTAPRGLKAIAKRILGRHGSEIRNARRAEFNTLLRQTYLGQEPVFDLARIESTGPDGQSATITWEGKTVPVLVDTYSDDGGHLNVDGRRRVARALVAFLATLPPSSLASGAK